MGAGKNIEYESYSLKFLSAQYHIVNGRNYNSVAKKKKKKKKNLVKK